LVRTRLGSEQTAATAPKKAGGIIVKRIEAAKSLAVALEAVVPISSDQQMGGNRATHGKKPPRLPHHYLL
jgi:hypothetical protein